MLCVLVFAEECIARGTRELDNRPPHRRCIGHVTPSVSSTPWPGCSGRPQWAVICDAVTAFEKTLSAADRQALQRMIKRR